MAIRPYPSFKGDRVKLAIVCSWLNQYGGAERVLEVLHDMYPQAPIYTSIYRPQALPERYRHWDIRTTVLDRLPLARRKHQLYLPLYPLAFESLDLRGYDVVLSLTSAFGHGVITPAETTHVCYCLTPARFLWSYHTYIEREGVGRLTRLALAPFLKSLRQWDLAAASRVDAFLAISRTVQRRIAKVYRRAAQLIYPPVDTSYAAAPVGQSSGLPPESEQSGSGQSGGLPYSDYFLVVSRLVPYKRIDLAVRAFNELGLPLRIIGEGRDRAALQALARPNIQFLGYLPDAEARTQMAHCRAFLFPGEEDFGIAPLEAMAAGRPVIAYAAGGALDTLAEGRTGVFFREATPASLAAAVRDFQTQSFDPATLRAHAQQFDTAVFQRQMAAVLERAAQGNRDTIGHEQ
jgi:glycosyltransferase involved in cell wall biosynthesis